MDRQVNKSENHNCQVVQIVMMEDDILYLFDGTMNCTAEEYRIQLRGHRQTRQALGNYTGAISER